jgi:hypothetical protein
MEHKEMGDYAPFGAPLAVLAAIGFGLWAWLTKWQGVEVVVLGHPAQLSAGFISLAGVTVAISLLMRASWRTIVATAALFGGFAFMWLIAQSAPFAVR